MAKNHPRRSLWKTIAIGVGGVAAFAILASKMLYKKKHPDEPEKDQDKSACEHPDVPADMEGVAMDTTGDGRIDTVLVDTDGNGTLDTILRDTDGDGKVDTVLTDDDEL